jgi:hypothetical protein
MFTESDINASNLHNCTVDAQRTRSSCKHLSSAGFLEELDNPLARHGIMHHGKAGKWWLETIYTDQELTLVVG